MIYFQQKSNILNYFQLHAGSFDREEPFIALFDGVCDKTKELQTLPDSMSMTNDVKWIFSSSGRYMFVRFAVDSSIYSSTGFFAKIHNGKVIIY